MNEILTRRGFFVLLGKGTVTALSAHTFTSIDHPRIALASRSPIFELRDEWFEPRATEIAEQMMTTFNWAQELGVFASCTTISEMMVAQRYMMNKKSRELALPKILQTIEEEKGELNPRIKAFCRNNRISELLLICAIEASSKIEDMYDQYYPPVLLAKIVGHETTNGIDFGTSTLARRYGTTLNQFLANIKDRDGSTAVRKPSAFNCTGDGYIGLAQIGQDTIWTVQNKKPQQDGSFTTFDPWDLVEGQVCIALVLNSKNKTNHRLAFMSYGGRWYNSGNFDLMTKLDGQFQAITKQEDFSLFVTKE